jgi:aminopeptidase N
MTLSIIGLKSLCLANNQLALNYLNDFYKKWKNNDLVIEKWFELMSTLNIKSQGLNLIKQLLKHRDFDYKNPNKLRSVLGTFQKENVTLFHANDSSGYKFISEQVAIIDRNNPQAAARLILPLTRFKNYSIRRKQKIKNVLKSINKPFISNDLSEIIDKALI